MAIGCVFDVSDNVYFRARSLYFVKSVHFSY